MPSKAVSTTASAIDLWSSSPRGRYHSTRELTNPNSKRLVIAGSTSVRRSPSAMAWPTSSATWWSNWRRRARAARSTSRVAADAQEQRDVRQALDEHGDAPANQLLQLFHGRAISGRDVLDNSEQPIEGVVESEPQQFLLARHVVIDRRRADTEALRQIPHPRAVEAPFVEHLDDDVERGRRGRSRGGHGDAAPPSNPPRSARSSSHRLSMSRCSFPGGMIQRRRARPARQRPR